jgi:hypothetical protein
MNERIIFHDQARKLQKTSTQEKDIFIFDRGYYSLDLMTKIFHFNRYFQLRLKKNMNIVQDLERLGVDDHTITINGQPVRVIKYVIINNSKRRIRIVQSKSGEYKKCALPKAFDDQQRTSYYLLTSLMDQTQYPVSKLKEMYHQRWSIEEN